MFKLFLLSIFLVYVQSRELHYEYVTCGSVLKLLNNQHSVRLHSHDVKYGQGSGQQSVTGVENSDDHNSYWQVKERNGSNRTCTRGKPVKCGQTIRLMHMATNRFLHSHHYSSPLSKNYEVSAFGENGVGDDGDNWIVQCTDDYWSRNNYISFKHATTYTYLYVSGDKYGRPIEGQWEISCVNYQNSAAEWMAAEGVFVKPTNTDSLGNNQSSSNSDPQEDSHEEL